MYDWGLVNLCFCVGIKAMWLHATMEIIASVWDLKQIDKSHSSHVCLCTHSVDNLSKHQRGRHANVSSPLISDFLLMNCATSYEIVMPEGDAILDILHHTHTLTHALTPTHTPTHDVTLI
jgi:hypothetical protein